MVRGARGHRAAQDTAWTFVLVDDNDCTVGYYSLTMGSAAAEAPRALPAEVPFDLGFGDPATTRPEPIAV